MKLNKLTKHELIKFIENSKINTIKNKTTLVEFLLALKSWLIKFTIVVLIIKWFKKYTWYRKVWSILSFISVSLFGVTLLDIYGITFLKPIFTWLQGSYLYGLISTYVFKIENPLKRADMPSKESLRESNKSSKGVSKNPRVSEWFTERHKLEEESNNNKYYMLLALLILLGFGWYYWDSITPIPGHIRHWFRTRRPDTDPGNGDAGRADSGNTAPAYTAEPNTDVPRSELNASSSINANNLTELKATVAEKVYNSDKTLDIEPTYNPLKWIGRKIKKKVTEVVDENVNKVNTVIEDAINKKVDSNLNENLQKLNPIADSISPSFSDYFKGKSPELVSSKDSPTSLEVAKLLEEEMSEKSQKIFDSKINSLGSKMSHFLVLAASSAFPSQELRTALYDTLADNLEKIQVEKPILFNTWFNSADNAELITNFKEAKTQLENEAGPSNTQELNIPENLETVVTQEQEAWSRTNSPASDKAVLGITQQFQKEFEEEVMSPQGLKTLSPKGAYDMSQLAIDIANVKEQINPRPITPKQLTSEQAIKEEIELQQEIANENTPLIANVDYQQAITDHSTEIDTNVILESIKAEDERAFKEKMKAVLLSAESVNKNLPSIPEVSIDKGSDSSQEHYFPEKTVTTEDVRDRMSAIFSGIKAKFKSYSSSSASSPAASNVGLQTPQFQLSPLSAKPSISNLFTDTNALFDDFLDTDIKPSQAPVIGVDKSFNPPENLEPDNLMKKKSLQSIIKTNESDIVKSDLSLNWSESVKNIDDENQSITLDLRPVIKNFSKLRIITTNNETIYMHMDKNAVREDNLGQYLYPIINWGSGLKEGNFPERSKCFSVFALDDQQNYKKLYQNPDFKF